VAEKEESVVAALGLPFELNKASKIPVRSQLADHFKQAILCLKLMPGQILPSSRELAKQLGVSRATCVRLYEDLIAEGFIETVEGKGTFVRQRLTTTHTSCANSEGSSDLPVSDYSRHLLQLQPVRLMAHDFPELNHGCSPAEFLPISQWRHALLECGRHFSEKEIDYGTEPFGYLPLREAICAYLRRSRMIESPVERLVVFSSSAFPLKAVAEMLIDQGDTIVFPEPGPLYARNIFKSLGANIITVATDEDGLCLENIIGLAPPIKLIYLNSSHHDPTGVALSLERRKLLLQWSYTKSTIILEDDYDAELRYAGAPLPSLRALSGKDNVVYISNFWRTLYPLVNLSYLVAPAQLAPVLSRAAQITYHAFHTHLPFLDQEAMIMILNQGHYEKHLRRVQSTFAGRWRTLVQELSTQFGKDAKIARESSSYHLYIQFSGKFSEDSLVRCAREAELPLIITRDNFAGTAPHAAFVIPFAHLSEEQIVHKVKAFRAQLPS